MMIIIMIKKTTRPMIMIVIKFVISCLLHVSKIKIKIIRIIRHYDNS